MIVMKSNSRELLDRVLEYHFACIELNLYNEYSHKFMQAKCDYEDEYGPLTNFGYVPDSYPWQWVYNPWPWDNELYK